MPVSTEYQHLLQAIGAQQKAANKLRWMETGREAEYVLRLANYAVVVSINQFTEVFNAGLGVKSPVLFQLLLPEGMEFGRFEVRPDDAEYTTARAIFDAASRTALKKGEMLRAVEEELRKIAV